MTLQYSVADDVEILAKKTNPQTSNKKEVSFQFKLLLKDGVYASIFTKADKDEHVVMLLEVHLCPCAPTHP
jgi:hypothetical protein